MTPATQATPFLHSELNLGPKQMVRVELEGNAANVRLLDDDNFSKYKVREEYSYFGGYATSSPVNLRPPSEGRWHLVVDLPGAKARVEARVSVVES